MVSPIRLLSPGSEAVEVGELTSIGTHGYRELPASGMRCDECERGFDEGAEIVVVYEDGGRLHATLVREHSSDANSLARLTGLNFHPACYETARVEEPSLPSLDSSG